MHISFAIFGVISLTAAGFLTTNSAAQGIFDEVLPPDILPVVILQGSDYEMGCQYGQQAGKYIVRNKEETWASALKNFSYDEVLNTLKANQYYIAEFTPQWIDMMRGIADGATAAGYQVSYIDVMLLNCTLPNPKT